MAGAPASTHDLKTWYKWEGLWLTIPDPHLTFRDFVANQFPATELGTAHVEADPHQLLRAPPTQNKLHQVLEERGWWWWRCTARPGIDWLQLWNPSAPQKKPSGNEQKLRSRTLMCSPANPPFPRSQVLGSSWGLSSPVLLNMFDGSNHTPNDLKPGIVVTLSVWANEHKQNRGWKNVPV